MQVCHLLPSQLRLCCTYRCSRYLTQSKTVPVVWKVTPLFASWLASPATNLFFRTGLLDPSSTVLELGCGVSALVGLAVGPLVSSYVLSDQSYVARFVEQNIQQNTQDQNRKQKPPPPKSSSTSRSNRGKSSSSSHPPPRNGSSAGNGTITFHPLDWELDAPTRALAEPDVVVACDCIYNDALIPPFVQTCVDACRLRPSDDDAGGKPPRPCVCVVAQQLRDPEIFEGWLSEFVRKGFRVWRVPDEELAEGLRSSSGFVVHVGVLREALE